VSGLVIDARTWRIRRVREKPSGCRNCGLPELPARTERVYCSPECAKKAWKIRNAIRQGRTPLDELREVERGTCPVCSAAVDTTPVNGRGFCSRTCKRRWNRRKDRRYAFGHFKSLVKWPHDLAWLAGKLGLAADDPRLPDLALRLAEAGKLVVYVRRDGTVGEVGKPKEGDR